jgi:hypothetical protein
MYADYYGAAMSFAKNPKQFGESTNQLATAESFLFISIDRREEISGMVSELNGQGGIVLFCVKHRDANHSGMTATLNGNHFRIYGPQRRPVAAAIGASKMQQKIVGLFRKDLEGLNVPVG